MRKQLLFILLVTLIAVPTIIRMLPSGLYSMQDFPYFRIVEYSKCLSDGQFPCRWAPDAALGYGEPVFNFYSHIPFLIGSLLTRVGISAISSLKLVFAFSLIGSALSMYLLATKVWGDRWAGLISSTLYLYAPYRAVNVWVRGALPESFAFVFLPLVIFFVEKYLEEEKKKWIIGISLSLAAIVLTHNLSVVLFAHAIFAWALVRLMQTQKWRLVPYFILAVIGSAGLSAFYLLPSVFESMYVNLQTTTQGYFDFRAHFVTIGQLFMSRYWGYGGSTWGDGDGLSLSIGHVQWIVSLVVIFIAITQYVIKRKSSQKEVLAIHLVLCGAFYLLLTHNKSTILWETFSPVMKYIQFPWRFLGVALFSFSLSAGYLVSLRKVFKQLAIVILVSTIFFNINYFHEDLWFQVSDAEMQSGERWNEQMRASIGDYWPTYAPVPVETTKLSFDNLVTTSSSFQFTSKGDGAHIVPIAYFPGWKAFSNGVEVPIEATKDGFIEITPQPFPNTIILRFTNTPVRNLGNGISFATILIFVAISLRNKTGKKRYS